VSAADQNRDEGSFPRWSPSARRALALYVALFTLACGRGETGEPPALDGDPLDAAAASNVLAESSDLDRAEASPPRPGRIILISLDTVGAQHVGGYSNAKTPNLMKIAQEGARFERFYAAATYTLPSHMSIMTGLSALEHGVVNSASTLGPETPTLASQLAAAGYHTRGYHEGGFMNSDYGFAQGFRSYEQKDQKNLAGVSIWSVLDWMRQMEEEPYFLFIHTFVAHVPYRGFEDAKSNHPELRLPPPDEVARLKKQYNKNDYLSFYPASREIPAEIRHLCTFYNTLSNHPTDFLGCGDRFILDEFTTSARFAGYRDAMISAHRSEIGRGDTMIGQIRNQLRKSGQLENTLLVVTSDHGDEIFEHGRHGHDYSPYDEVVKVPLFLSYPERLRGGQVIEGLTWHLDLAPTILSLAGLPVPENLRGQDLSKVLSGEKSIAADRAIHPVLLRPANRNFLPMRRMVLQGDFKYIEGHEIYGDPEGLLFDLSASPLESENLREAKPRQFDSLATLSQSYAASLRPGSPIHQTSKRAISAFPGEVEPLEYPEERRNELEALGYLFDD
jgi:arylsulfatase A-like enzyme